MHSKKIKLFLCATLISSFSICRAQDLSKGEIHGNFEINAQTYTADSLINAKKVNEKMLMNSFMNVNYTNGNLSAGVRFESYLNPLSGFDPRYQGTGIPYKYVTYKANELEITAGNYYEQFGNGLIFRSYEERGLGIDNAMNGIRVKYTPFKGVYFKGIVGTQRFFWEEGTGILRGVDAELDFNEAFAFLKESKTKLLLGGSFISKFQKDDSPTYYLPDNVAAYSGRINLTRGKFGLTSEYAYKINDPSAANNYIYKPGEALLVTTTYSQKGLGITLSAKRIDNMNFHSDRNTTGNPLSINYLPALTRQHVYALSAMYPYGTQANGEMGLQGDVVYQLKKGTALGGAYGTTIAINYSRVSSIYKAQINDSTKIDQAGTMGYKTDFFRFGNEKYFEDINFEISKKINKEFKFTANYVNLTYNKNVILGQAGYSDVYAQVAIFDITYKVKPTQALRLETQHLWTKQDKGNWAMALLEYSIAPKWFFTVYDQYNYGNSDAKERVHYPNVAFGYTKGSNRIQLGYGKQRDGIICVGGVCRNVPASNGFNISITSSF